MQEKQDVKCGNCELRGVPVPVLAKLLQCAWMCAKSTNRQAIFVFAQAKKLCHLDQFPHVFMAVLKSWSLKT